MTLRNDPFTFAPADPRSRKRQIARPLAFIASVGAMLFILSVALIHSARAQVAAPAAGADAALQPRDFGELSRVAEARSPFRVLDVYVDSGNAPLAAYQFEFKTTQKNAGEVKLVGIEGGDPAAFKEPPRYDPRALAQPAPRVIVAAFNTGKDLPSGRTRVARLMVRVAPGVPTAAKYEGQLTVAASPDAKPIAGAQLQIVEGALP